MEQGVGEINISNKEIGKSNNLGFNLQERILAGAIVKDNKKATTDYKINKDGYRVNDNELNLVNNNLLIDKYKENPFKATEILRENMFAIMKDGNNSKEDKEKRLDRYLDSYFGLINKLDKRIFLNDENKVINRVPRYIPDGLSDMGSDSELKPEWRSREKIRINKNEIFKQSRDLFKRIFKTEIPSNINKNDLEMYILKNVMFDVDKNIKYDYQNENNSYFNKSIGLHQLVESRLGVCRHQAMLAQVLLQSFGLESRLVKGTVVFADGNLGRHANNLVKLGDNWNLIDVTNKDRDINGKGDYFIRPIKEDNIDLNNKKYVWNFIRKDNSPVKYETDNKMYYRVVDNLKNPIKK